MGTSFDHSGPLANKVAIVTGAGRGLGRAFALRLAGRGARVAVIDRDLQSYREFAGEQAVMTADSTVAEIISAGGTAIGFEADVTDAVRMAEVASTVVAEFGRIDVAICNAGGSGGGPLTGNAASELAPEALDAVMRRNLYGTVFTCTAVSPAMKQRRSGSIVTLSSTDGLESPPGGAHANYAVAKAAVVMYTRCLAQDLGPYGVRANVIAPGVIGTGRIRPMIDEMGGDAVMERIPLRRIGTTGDVAGVVEFLASDLSDYVTGQVIAVDGGMAAWRAPYGQTEGPGEARES